MALLVNQQRELDSGVFAKEPGVLPISQANHRQNCPALFELQLMFAQLRYVLAAEDSSVVPQENQDSRLLRPQRAEPHRPPVAVRQNNVGESLTERASHVSNHYSEPAES